MVEATKEEIKERQRMGEIFKRNVFDTRKRLEEKFDKKFGPKPSHNIDARDLGELYFKAIQDAIKFGEINYIDSGSYKGEFRLEFPDISFCVTHPTSRPLAPQPRPGIIVSTNDKQIENYFWKELMEGSLLKNQHYTYGSWIRGIPEEQEINHKGIPRGTRLDQLEWNIKHFVTEGYGTNHGYITIGCAEGLQRYDWPYKNENEKGSTECMRYIGLKIRGEENDKRLDIKTLFRSWDLSEGLPQNLGGLVMLMEYTVQRINEEKSSKMPEVRTGYLKGTSDGLHIYQHSLDVAKASIGMDK